jgi:RHS repeat-associated protein
LTGSEEVQFLYGPDRQRWKQIYTSPTPTETTYYVGGLMDVVFVSSTTNYRHYIYAGREPIAVYSRTAAGVNTMSYMLEDHQGGVSNIASKTGAVDVNESFSAFGTRRNPTTWSGAPSTTDLNTIAGLSRQGYTFQTWLGQSMGLNHMNGRVQDAILGRFLSPDPHISDPSDAQSYDRYTYAGNNPLTYVDPSGFEHCPHAPCPDVGDGSDGGTPDGGTPGGDAPDGGTPGGGTPTPGVPGQFYNPDDPSGIPTVTGIGTPTLGVPGQFYNPDDPSGIPTVTGIASKPQGAPHHYSIYIPTSCSSVEASNTMKQPGYSGPGAPAAQEGTSAVPLFGVFSPNPITQVVTTTTITNITAGPTHILYDGSVIISTIPQGNRSDISIVGQGFNSYSQYALFNYFLARFNEVFGSLYFGLSALSVEAGCDMAAGAYYVQ